MTTFLYYYYTKATHANMHHISNSECREFKASKFHISSTHIGQWSVTTSMKLTTGVFMLFCIA